MSKKHPIISEEDRKVLDAICKVIADDVMATGGSETARELFGPAAASVDAHQIAKSLPELLEKRYATIVVNEATGEYSLQITDKARREISASTEIIEWMRAGLRAERISGTRMHDFRTAVLADNLANVQIKFPDALFPGGWSTIGVFVVEHDWASAFAEAEIENITERRLPFPVCCFELNISGRRVCAFLDQETGGCTAAVETSVGWTLLNADLGFLMSVGVDVDALLSVVNRQVDAILVALDSGVATTEVIRAPAALNKARARRGKPPIFDYHAVKLARRARAASLPVMSGTPDRASPRLHFRRGHWRQLETYKVWINWTLVGDPDLGFIDKHYRL